MRICQVQNDISRKFASRPLHTYVFTYAHKWTICAGMSTPEAFAELIRKERESRDLTQEQFAEIIGATQTQVSRWEDGQKMQQKNLRKVAEFFGIPYAELWDLMVESASRKKSLKLNRPPKPTGQLEYTTASDVPVYGSAQGGPDGVFMFNGQAIDWVERPPHLVGKRNIYALYIEGESMVSRYNPGDTVWLNPTKPKSPRDGIVIQLRPDREGESPYGFIKEYVRTTPTKLVVRQLNPEMEIEYDLDQVVTTHTVDNIRPR